MTPALSVDAAMGRLSPMSEPTALSENPASDTTGSVVNAVTPSHPIADLGEKIEVLRVEAYILPKCDLPPPSELEPIETFVSNAIQSQHDENADPTFVQGYRAIADSLRRPEDPAMLRTIITALRTAGKGSTLYQMTSSQKHAMLTHLIFKFNSFDIPRKLKEADEQVLQPFRDYSMADAHFQLILALISAKSVNVVPAMTAVWKMLTFSRSEAPEPM
jgi:RNA polymerase I-specific transcription initiation factor RRN3